MTPEQAKALRDPFPPETVGKLPRITCRNCRNASTKVCPEHSKSECGLCRNYITTRHIHLDFVGHAAVTARLLLVDPEWTWEPVSFDPAGQPQVILHDGMARMWIRLTVAGVTRLGVGIAPADKDECEKELISDALRNAAMRFGVALDLWSKEELPTFEAAAGPVPTPGPETGTKATSKPSSARESDVVPAAAPSFEVGEATLTALLSRVSALLADKVPVADERIARGLPPLKHPLTDEQANGWADLLDELETNVTISKIVPA